MWKIKGSSTNGHERHDNKQKVPVDDIKLRPPIFKFTLKIQVKIVFFKGKITYI